MIFANSGSADSGRLSVLRQYEVLDTAPEKALDDLTAMAAEMPTANPFTLQAAPDAFRDLTQWNPLAVQQVRDDLVTESSLGDPELVGLERQRELSGFELLIDVKRKMYFEFENAPYYCLEAEVSTPTRFTALRIPASSSGAG